MGQHRGHQAVKFFPILHAALSGSEFRVQQPRLLEELGPDLHRSPSGAGGGQCHFAVFGGQVHPVHHIPIASSSFGAPARETVGMDQAGGGANGGFHGGQVYVLTLPGLLTVE